MALERTMPIGTSRAGFSISPAALLADSKPR